jgi:hypothetical protein
MWPDVVTLLYVFAYPAAYIVLLWLFARFFNHPRPKFGVHTFRSILTILASFLFFFSVSLLVPNEEWGNRILHALAGGFTATLMCYVAARDSCVRVTRFQFLVFSLLVVTALGVANEVAEFFGQRYTYLAFAPHINDTWLDLISNTIGIFLGLSCLVPWWRKITA